MQNHNIHEDENLQAIDADPITQEKDSNTDQRISLRKYLKNIGLEAQQKRLIKRRFATAYGSDVRVLQQAGEFYLDLSKFDYSDLLKV